MLRNRVGESGTQETTGEVTVSGPLAGYVTFSASGVEVAGAPVTTLIYQSATKWELTRVTRTGISTFSRMAVPFKSTNGGLLEDFDGDLNIYGGVAVAEVFGPIGGAMFTALAEAETSGVYVAAMDPPMPFWQDGAFFILEFNEANAGPDPTIEIDGSDPKIIKNINGAALAENDIAEDSRHVCSYDGAHVRVLTIFDATPFLTPDATETVKGKAELATPTEAFTGTDTARIVTPEGAARWHRRGADIASSANIALPADGGTVFAITGTTTIETISVRGYGERVLFIVLAGFTISHDAGKIVARGGMNLQTDTGDMVEFVCHGPGADPTKGVWQVCNHWSYAIPTITDVVNITQGVTNTQNDPGTSYGDTGLQADITVLKADSGIKVSVSFPWQDAAGNETLVFRVTRSGIDVTGDLKVGVGLTANTVSMVSFTFIDGVGATGGHTYKLQAKCTAGGGAVHLFAAGATVFGIGAIVLQEMKNS